MKTLKDAVKEFCVKKLARLLYDYVDCSLSDRADTDWKTAEAFVKDNDHLVIRMVWTFTAAVLRDQLNEATAIESEALSLRVDCSFKAIERVCGDIVCGYLFCSLQSKLPRPLYGQVRAAA